MEQILPTAITKEQRKIIWLSSIGGLLEFYDFTIYGLFAGYFAKQFFPATDVFISLIASYSIFVIGYVVRPIGGILFSHIGDEIGRKTVLIITMLLMGISSIGIALLPTYAQIGAYAPALMLVFRLLQGLAIGGELPSIMVYISESMPQQRGFGLGGIFTGTVAGLIPGMLINLIIVNELTTPQVASYGWRIPFLIGGVLCFIAYRIRRELQETIEFKRLKVHSRFPIVELFKYHFKNLLIGIGIVAIMATPVILVLIFMPAYLIQILKLDALNASYAVLAASVISVISIYTMGILTRHYNLFKLTWMSLILIAFGGIICYYLLSINASLLLALFLFAIAQGFLVTLAAVFLSYLFPLEIRLTGVAVSYNISFVLFGGLAPMVITSMIKHTGMVYGVPLAALFVSMLVMIIALGAFKKTVNLQQ